VVDIACGKGEFLVRLAELYGISGIGVDLSPYCIEDCREKKKMRAPDADLEFLEMDGADYSPEEGRLFDVSSCIGASWVYSGHEGTLKSLSEMTKPGGLVVVGEPFWLGEPSHEYLESQEIKREDYGTHRSNIEIGESLGLNCIYTLVSSHDDWDHYETLQWLSLDNYIQRNPDDEDIPKIVEKLSKFKMGYIEEGRDILGWAIYVFRKPQ
jgi:SAM-dependent methyltransferase